MGRAGREGGGRAGQRRSGPRRPGLTKGPCVLPGQRGAGRASALGMGIWLQSETLLCFLFNYNGPGSYKGSFCWGSLGEGGRQGWLVWDWGGSMGKDSTQTPLSDPWDGRFGGMSERAASVGGGRAAECEPKRHFSMLHICAKLQILTCNPAGT